MHQPQQLGVSGKTMIGAEADYLIGQNRAGRSDFPVFHYLIAGVAFQPGHEPNALEVEAVKPGIVNIASIHD